MTNSFSLNTITRTTNPWRQHDVVITEKGVRNSNSRPTLSYSSVDYMIKRFLATGSLNHHLLVQSGTSRRKKQCNLLSKRHPLLVLLVQKLVFRSLLSTEYGKINWNFFSYKMQYQDYVPLACKEERLQLQTLLEHDTDFLDTILLND